MKIRRRGAATALLLTMPLLLSAPPVAAASPVTDSSLASQFDNAYNALNASQKQTAQQVYSYLTNSLQLSDQDLIDHIIYTQGYVGDPAKKTQAQPAAAQLVRDTAKLYVQPSSSDIDTIIQDITNWDTNVSVSDVLQFVGDYRDLVIAKMQNLLTCSTCTLDATMFSKVRNDALNELVWGQATDETTQQSHTVTAKDPKIKDVLQQFGITRDEFFNIRHALETFQKSPNDPNPSLVQSADNAMNIAYIFGVSLTMNGAVNPTPGTSHMYQLFYNSAQIPADLVNWSIDNNNIGTFNGNTLTLYGSAVPGTPFDIIASIDGFTVLQRAATVGSNGGGNPPPPPPPPVTPTPPPVPSPGGPPPTTVDGSQDTSVTLGTNSNGQSVAQVTVDTGKLASQITGDTTPKDILIPVNVNAQAVQVQLPATFTNLVNSNNSDSVLEVRTTLGSYSIPAPALSAQQLGSALGVAGGSLDLSKVTIQIQVQPSTVPVTNSVAPVLEFTITVSDGIHTVSLDNTGNTYLGKTVPLTKTVDPTQVTGVVVNKNADGTVSYQTVPTLVETINGQQYATLERPGNSVYTVIQHTVSFHDTSGNWAANTIQVLGNKMVITGYGDGSFQPGNPVTRAELAAMIVRALGLTPGTAGGFGDVKPTDWYAGWTGTLKNYGMVKGYPDGSFHPDAPVTREEAFVMVQRAIQFVVNMQPLTYQQAAQVLAGYKDASQLQPWGVVETAELLQENVVSGYPDKSLRPGQTISRAEAATILLHTMQGLNFTNP